MSNAAPAQSAPTPDSPEIVITISGRPRVGKSTLAMFLALCLEKVGIDVEEIKNEDTLPDELARTFQDRLKHVAARKPIVTIDMGQLERDKVKLILPGGAHRG